MSEKKKLCINHMNIRNIAYGFVILALVIIVWYFTRKPAVVKNVSNKPEIVFSDSFYTINISKVESYVIENYSSEELTKLVEVNLKWKNKGGFENVSSIKIERLLETTGTGGVKTSSVLETITELRTGGKSAWFTNFSKSDNVCTFTNLSSNGTAYDGMGVNKFKFYFMLDNSTDWVEIASFNTISVTLNESEIQIAVDSEIKKTVVFSPIISAIPVATEEYLNKPVFFSSLYGTTNTSLSASINGRFDIGFDILLATPSDSTSTEIVLRKNGTNVFLQENLTLGNRTTALKLNIIKYTGNQVLLGTVVSDKVDKVIVYGNVSNKLGFKVIKFNEITEEIEYNSMKFNTSTVVPNISSDCTMILNTEFEGCNTGISSKTSGDVTHERGKYVKKYTMQSPAFGASGTCSIDGVNLLSPSTDTNSWQKYGDNTYYTIKPCAAPTVWSPKSDIEASCKLKIGNYYLDSELSNRYLSQSEAYDYTAAVNTRDTGGPGQYDCLNVIPAATASCPAVTTTPGACQYSSTGSSTTGYRYYTYSGNNNNDCIHRSVPSDGVREDTSGCGPQCHTPNYKAYWAGCDFTRGEFANIYDTKAWDQKSGQPLCSGITNKHGWVGYSEGKGPYDMCGDGDDEYGDYGYFLKGSKDNDTDITAATTLAKNFSLSSNEGTITYT